MPSDEIQLNDSFFALSLLPYILPDSQIIESFVEFSFHSHFSVGSFVIQTLLALIHFNSI
jgi:hypothetical protein